MSISTRTAAWGVTIIRALVLVALRIEDDRNRHRDTITRTSPRRIASCRMRRGARKVDAVARSAVENRSAFQRTLSEFDVVEVSKHQELIDVGLCDHLPIAMIPDRHEFAAVDLTPEVVFPLDVKRRHR